MCDGREYIDIIFQQMAQLISLLKLSHIFRKRERCERKSCQTSIMMAAMVCNIHECDVTTHCQPQKQSSGFSLERIYMESPRLTLLKQ
jgi:hypothetical protein